MPELTLFRTNATPPPPACMYCGEPATARQEWRVVNRKLDHGGGSGNDLSPVVLNDDPVSAVVGLVLLPLALWDLLKGLAGLVGWAFSPSPRPVAPPAPPRDLPTTLVVVTTCERHRRFRDRFVWAGVAGALALVALWAAAVSETRRAMGTDEVDLAATLVLSAVAGTALLPIALGVWYSFGGPVIVERVTEKTVVLDRVRRVYFTATGLKPSNED
jgi:hypothetical protein